MTFARKFIELGIQACIVGLGISGALFANDTIRTRLGSNASAIGITAIFVDLIVVGFCLHLRTDPLITDPMPGARAESHRACASIFLGLLILGLNSEIVFRYY